MKNECTFIILGATGDLTKRKLIPAIYKLIENKKITKFAVVGAARHDTNVKKIVDDARQFISKPDEKIIKKLEESFYFVNLDFYKEADFLKLKEKIEAVEKKHGLARNTFKRNRIFYLATMPKHFEVITKHLSKAGIVESAQEESDTISRVVYEKPFGEDLQSAKKINKCIARVFDESQVYRIDHYLGKELVGNIALVRFTNTFFQPLWNNKYIDSVHIVLDEKIGVEERCEFYEQYGALKDIVQSHLMQMLALVAMEPPKKLSGDYIRDAKANVLKQVKVHDVILGQYDGYTKQKCAKKDSTTETFAFLKVEIKNKRWRGVPFYLKTGKCLNKKKSSILVQLKKPDCLFDQGCAFEPNWISIGVQPNEGLSLQLNGKVPGVTYDVTPIKMDFCHSCLFGPNTPQAYEVLLHSVLKGDQSVFVRFDEIEHSWKLIDEIKTQKHVVHEYKKGSTGPWVLEEYLKKNRVYKL
jgi:glucose-6-phosphate 1-dehydrogenase